MQVRMRAGINGPNIYAVPQCAGHNNLFTRTLTMDKYIGFDIDDKKTVACVVQKGGKAKYSTFKLEELYLVEGRLKRVTKYLDSYLEKQPGAKVLLSREQTDVERQENALDNQHAFRDVAHNQPEKGVSYGTGVLNAALGVVFP